MTPLHIAVKLDWSDVVDLFLSYRADPDTLTQFNQTPLHIACSQKCAWTVEVLLWYNAKSNIKDTYGLKPYDIANNNKSFDILKLLNPKSHTSDSFENMYLTNTDWS